MDVQEFIQRSSMRIGGRCGIEAIFDGTIYDVQQSPYSPSEVLIKSQKAPYLTLLTLTANDLIEAMERLNNG